MAVLKIPDDMRIDRNKNLNLAKKTSGLVITYVLIFLFPVIFYSENLFLNFRRIRSTTLADKYTVTMDNLKVGESAIVVSFTEAGQGYRLRLAHMGLRIGSRIKILYKEPFGGPLLIEVNGIKLAIGEGVARKIMVLVERDLPHDFQ